MANITSLGDISGQLSEKSANADKVTVGCVCLPSGAVKFIRRQIPANLPKWRNAKDEHVDFVVDLLLRESLSICASSTDKTTQDWKVFWEDADDVHTKTAQLDGGSISYVKAATVLKYMFFSEAATLAFMHSVNVGTLPDVRDNKNYLNVGHEMILDNDIQGDDNIATLVEILIASNTYQPLLDTVRARHTVDFLTIATEQAEPLLLLPDYVAGIFHASNSSANTMSQSAVTQLKRAQAHTRLMNDKKFHEPVQPMRLKYFEIFPLFEQYSRRYSTPQP